MNINQLLKKLKEHLGLSKYLKTSYTDKDLYDIIVTHALRDWGYYFKHEYDPGTIYFDPESAVGSDKMVLPTYLLDSVKRAGVIIEDIRNIRFTGKEILGNTTLNMGLVQPNNMSPDDLFTGMRIYNINNDFQMYSNYRYSCWFEKPNSLRFNYRVDRNVEFLNILKKANASLYVTQSPNLIGIDPGRMDMFFELCKYHIQRVLYENEIKYMENISSGTGAINLKVEEWAQAGEKLRELEEKMKEYGALTQNYSTTI